MNRKFFPEKVNFLMMCFVAAFILMFSTSKVHSQIFVEAENYSLMNGIQTEGTSDEGGGLNVGWIDSGDWMEYTLQIPVTGEYLFSFRAASQQGGTLKISDDGTEIQSVTITATGGWQNWKTINASGSVSLDAGQHTVRLNASPGGFNLNWFKMAITSPADTDVPTAPVIVKSTTSVHSVSLVWQKSSDVGNGVVGYQILKNNTFYQYTVDTFLNVSKLPHNTSFELSVVATDLAGNSSAATSISVTTDTLPWEISWADEFNIAGDVDRSKWNFQTGGDGWGNGEAQYYTDGKNATIVNGELIIEARQENFGNNKFTSTRMNSSGKGDFLFGRIEARAKLPKTGGTWPAFWTLPTEWVYGAWPDCGEIDIMEHSATSGYGHVFGTIHTGAYNHVDGTQKSGGTNYTDVTDQYHTYAIEWYPDHIDWYYDDEIVFTFNNEYKTAAEWPFNVKHHVLLNLAIGGGLGGTINTGGTWPQQYVVDYVRVYDFNLGENDTIAPIAPTLIEADEKWSSINLSWNLAADNYAIKEYYIFLDGVVIDTVLGNAALVQNLLPLTHYVLGVQACDYAGNVSDTAFLNATTPEIAGIKIPAKIQAENFTAMQGIDTEACTDDGGGTNVGWIDAGDWLTFTIDVEETAEYRANFRLASQGASGILQLLDASDNELTQINTPVTGGWQSWKSVLSEPFSLSQGIYTVKISTTTGNFNLNWFEIKGKDDFSSVENTENQRVLIYPNPLTETNLMAELPIADQSISIIITATDGRVLVKRVEELKNNRIEIRHIQLKSGIYFISFVTPTKAYTQTLSVN